MSKLFHVLNKWLKSTHKMTRPQYCHLLLGKHTLYRSKKSDVMQQKYRLLQRTWHNGACNMCQLGKRQCQAQSLQYKCRFVCLAVKQGTWLERVLPQESLKEMSIFWGACSRAQHGGLFQPPKSLEKAVVKIRKKGQHFKDSLDEKDYYYIKNK